MENALTMDFTLLFLSHARLFHVVAQKYLSSERKSLSPDHGIASISHKKEKLVLQSLCLCLFMPLHQLWGLSPGGRSCHHFLNLVIFGHAAACGILVPPPRTEPIPPASEARSFNQWTTKEVPHFLNFRLHLIASLHFRDEEGTCPRSQAYMIN